MGGVRGLHRIARASRWHRATPIAVIEDGIRTKLRTERTRSAFRLRDAAVKGSGLQPEFRDAGWPAVRKAIYEGRGA